MHRIWRTVGLLAVCLAAPIAPLAAQTKNGFDLSGALVPPAEVLLGGPPRDGIPTLTDPRFERASVATWLDDDDRVLALEGGQPKAYPIRILNWHEVVNDQVGGQPVAITYCPLCGTGMAFDPHVGGNRLTFGVSGLLYNSDVLLYDRETESLWTQIGRRAVSGPLRGKELRQIPLLHTTWGRWRERHTNSLVLSRETGFERDYDRDPYLGYASEQRLWFPVGRTDERLPSKALVLGIERPEGARAYPFEELRRVPSPVRDRIGDDELFVYFDRDSDTAFATDLESRPLAGTVAYWFAWSAFHPGTGVWTGDVERKGSPAARTGDERIGG